MTEQELARALKVTLLDYCIVSFAYWAGWLTDVDKERVEVYLKAYKHPILPGPCPPCTADSTALAQSEGSFFT